MKFKSKASSKLCLVSEFNLSTTDVPTKITLFQTGYYVPGYGSPIDMKKDGLERIIENFNNKLIPRPSVYYGHFDLQGGRKAAGEIMSVFLKYDETTAKERLMGDIEWTPAAIEAIKQKEYKFISSEIHPNFMRDFSDTNTQEYGMTLMGAALVNEPGVWDIPTIFCLNDSKKLAKIKKDQNNNPEGDYMDELLKLFGVKTKEEAIGLFGSMKEKLEKFEKEDQTAKFKAGLAEKEKEIEALKKEKEEMKAAAFATEKETYLKGLFKENKITADAMKKYMDYNESKFSAIKEVIGDFQAVLPKLEGDGKEPKKEPETQTFEAYAEGKKTDINAGVK